MEFLGIIGMGFSVVRSDVRAARAIWMSATVKTTALARIDPPISKARFTPRSSPASLQFPQPPR